MKTTNPFRRNAAILAAAAVVGGLGIGGLATANADSGNTGPAPSQVQQSDKSDGDGEANDATEVEGAEEANDGADQAPTPTPTSPATRTPTRPARPTERSTPVDRQDRHVGNTRDPPQEPAGPSVHPQRALSIATDARMYIMHVDLQAPPPKVRAVIAFALSAVLLGAGTACAPSGGPTTDHASGLAPSLTQSPTTRLAVAGDTGTGAGSAIEGTVEEMLAQDDSFGYDGLLLLGDLIYPEGDAQQAPARISGVFDPLTRRGARLIPVLGNHDYMSDEQTQILQVLGRPTSWYVETVGIVRVVVLDTEQVDNSEQRAWLQKTLATPSDAPWTIVAMHKPAYSAGYHGSDELIQETWVPLFEQYDVPLVLAGHDHDYQRSTPINGVTYVVSGGAATLRPTGSQSFTAVSASVRHFLDLAVTPTELLGRAIDQHGDLLDSFTLNV